MKVIIGDNNFKVKLCTTEKSIKEGMMGKRFNKDFNGMLFMMPESGEQSFWTYNCIIPLDIIIIDNGVISVIHSNCTPCDDITSCKSYTGNGSEVLEIYGVSCEELNIKKGDHVSFLLF